ncbi:MarR family winged helix-turn-helix transcriptional regulator [Shimia marina]|uniref:Nicotinate degradation protein R n=1 Tax=Shimia marina TaxID=321267 RepID=A0A0P1ETK5_9RHOB|nr:MarR family transcriptional regulator [Shimia marina]CUH53603.1 Nicotinate degradation protein R [Shimia marina]SFD73111.1 DNA-binding transcriptional regulator, MarR family [Shimia marina]
MTQNKATPKTQAPDETALDYRLDAQVGFLMRRANQRHLAIFAEGISDLTPTQFAALAKLCEVGALPQNALGRATAMDAATIKGVVDRLRARNLVESMPDPKDQRRVLVKATSEGWSLFETRTQAARQITKDTLSPLNETEQTIFLLLLQKLL